MAGRSLLPAAIVVSLLSDVILAVEIVSMAVPPVVEAGVHDIVLDCEYEYTEEEKNQLDIKWYFNNNPEPIYQWLPLTSGPQVIGDQFRHHLDLDYQVNKDQYKKHRALNIRNPQPHLSGTYMCKVSTFIDEDFMQKDLLVYAPPHSLVFDQVSQTDFSSLNVTCEASGMYPPPLAKLTWANKNSSHEFSRAVLSVREDGLFDASLTATIEEHELGQQVTVGCEISLPGTQFSIQEQTVVYPTGRGSQVGSGNLIHSASLPLLLLLAAVVSTSFT